MRTLLKTLGTTSTFLVLMNLAAHAQTVQFPPPNPPLPCGPEYTALKKQLIQGWNTWDTRSVLTHVLMPEGTALRLQIHDPKTCRTLENALIRVLDEPDSEKIQLGAHAYDGSYTDLTIQWQGIAFRLQTASVEGDQVFLITPQKGEDEGRLVIRPEKMFGRPGSFTIEKDFIEARSPGKYVVIHVVGQEARNEREYIAVSLKAPIGLSTNLKRSLVDIRKAIETARQRFEQSRQVFGDLADLYDAQQSALAWNLIYDSTKDRIISTVSRRWSAGQGGYILFCWDTYFAAYMLALDNQSLAYAHAIEITKEITDTGFVPNFGGTFRKSLDRSQPPVGALVVREIYRKYPETWFLREVFDDLLRWNRWWEPNRVTDGLLCWGSNPYPGYENNPREKPNVNSHQGAMFESGLDNSPMYDNIPYDPERHQMKLADVGLTAMFVMDCEALAELADVLGKKAESSELRARAAKYRRNLAGLWSEKTGLYLNKRTDTGEFSPAPSPTNFYPLLAKAPTLEQAERMIREHFYNPAEFWGEWIMPSIARNHPAFKDNTYWRGRVWAPLNFLVYLGMRNYPLDAARRDLVDKSAKLLLKAWRENRHVYENYNAVSGVGGDVKDSDQFYHWGALVGFMSFIEKGYLPAPEKPLPENPGKK